MFPLPATRTYDEGLPPKIGIQGFWDSLVPVSGRTEEDTVCETPENPDFLRKDKMVISVEIRNFSRSQKKKRTSPLESSREI